VVARLLGQNCAFCILGIIFTKQHSSPKLIGLTVRLKRHNVRYDGVADCGRTHLTSISLLHLR
jgi:hypothetical protein